MNNSINISRRTSTAALISILFAVCALLFVRLNKSIFAAAKSAWRWLFVPKTYFAGDGDGVTVNGLQLICINLIAFAVCMLLSVSL